jgi:hypothetical protein
MNVLKFGIGDGQLQVLVYEAFSYWRMRPLVYEALSYKCMRP